MIGIPSSPNTALGALCFTEIGEGMTMKAQGDMLIAILDKVHQLFFSTLILFG
jgi:hypothetical protein